MRSLIGRIRQAETINSSQIRKLRSTLTAVLSDKSIALTQRQHFLKQLASRNRESGKDSDSCLTARVSLNWRATPFVKIGWIHGKPGQVGSPGKVLPRIYADNRGSGDKFSINAWRDKSGSSIDFPGARAVSRRAVLGSNKFWERGAIDPARKKFLPDRQRDCVVCRFDLHLMQLKQEHRERRSAGKRRR
jgi:hypothetical protein